jgi:hypothetical protein
MAARDIVPVLLAAAVLAPASALGSKATSQTFTPTSAQQASIVKAFGDPAAAARCLIVRLAASNHGYATVRFRSTKGCLRWAFDGKNILRRGDHERWSIAFEGSAYRCPLARIPRQVQRQLGVCP